MAYDYVDIRSDESGRMRVKQINAGNESVPTLLFTDGSTLTEPSNETLQARLKSLGYDLTPLSVFDRMLLQLEKPIIRAFGFGFAIGGWLAGSLAMVILGVVLILVPWVARILRKVMR